MLLPQLRLLSSMKKEAIFIQLKEKIAQESVKIERLIFKTSKTNFNSMINLK